MIVTPNTRLWHVCANSLHGRADESAGFELGYEQITSIPTLEKWSPWLSLQYYRAGLERWLRAHGNLAADCAQFPAPTQWFTTIPDSSSWRSDALLTS